MLLLLLLLVLLMLLGKVGVAAPPVTTVAVLLREGGEAGRLVPKRVPLLRYTVATWRCGAIERGWNRQKKKKKNT